MTDQKALEHLKAELKVAIDRSQKDVAHALAVLKDAQEKLRAAKARHNELEERFRLATGSDRSRPDEP